MRLLLTLLIILIGLVQFATMANVPQVDGVKIEVLQEGRGSKEAANRDHIAMHYRGTLEDGSQFDASYDRGKPLDFTLGSGQVIQGWDLGLVGTKIGEKRRLTIQPDKGYGKRGFPGAIPPNAVLIFETELVSINGKKDEL